jgi:predicted RNA-binding Zn ribbon-like protein
MNALALANTVIAVRGSRIDTLDAELGLTGLRDAIRGLFDAATLGEAPPAGAVELVNRLVQAPRLRWEPAGGPGLAAETSAAEAARTAIELLAGGRLRRCGNARCVQFFLADGRRAYCCAACANRVRVARHEGRTTRSGDATA